MEAGTDSYQQNPCVNEDEVKQFLSNLEPVMEKKFAPRSVFSIDESGVSAVQKPGQVIVVEGQKQVGIASSWEREKKVTMCCAMGTAGTYILHMFIFP
jgi:hypothetical protein